MPTEIFMKPTLLDMLYHACVEVYKNESSGFLTGRNEMLIGTSPKTLFYADGVHPLQTNKRTPYETNEDPQGAARSMDFLKSLGNVIGGYHSHSSDNDREMEESSRLSTGEESDVNYCLVNMKLFDLNQWLEIVIPIRKRRYSEPRKLGLSYRGNLDFSVRISPYTGYDFRMAPYWILPSGKIKPAILHTSNEELLSRTFLKSIRRGSKRTAN